MYRLTQMLTVACTLLVGIQAPAQAADLVTALKNIPQSSNSLGIIKIQQLVNSPLGKKEEWAKKHQSQFLAGAVHIPPTVDFVIRAFEFHPEDTRYTRSFGIASMVKPVAMSSLAQHEKSKIEMISGHAAVHTGRNTYFAELSPGMIGGVSPGYRQDLARWLREIDSGNVRTVSPYLQEVAAQAGDAQVILALDFKDLVDPKSWRERIKTSSAVVDKPNAINTLAQLADGLRGVTLKISVTDKTTAMLVLDFDTVVSKTTKDFLKPIVLDLLGEAGASLEDLAEGEVDLQDKVATITFGLSDAGLRQIMSILLMPSLSYSEEESTAGTGDAAKPTLMASRNYFAATNQILNDLEALAKKGGNYNRSATWHDNFAKKIDQLSLRGVDPDLVAYGVQLASNLRALAVSLRGVPVDVNTLQGSITYNVQYQPAGFYNSNASIWSTVSYQPEYYNVQTNQAEIRGQQAKAIAAGTKQREEIWQILADDRQKIRVKMLEKFGRDFEIQR